MTSAKKLLMHILLSSGRFVKKNKTKNKNLIILLRIYLQNWWRRDGEYSSGDRSLECYTECIFLSALASGRPRLFSLLSVRKMRI